MTYTIVRENGNFLGGRAYEEVVDAVQKDRTSCMVDGYTVHILEVDMTDVKNTLIKVKVEGIDEETGND